MTPNSIRTQKLSILSGIAWGVLFFVALAMAGQFPPPNPMNTGAETLAVIQSNILLAKASIPIGILAAGLSIPINALISGHIWRIESQEKGTMPLLTITAFGGGMGNIVFFFMVFLAWAGIFYRPDVAPEVVRVVHDTTWLLIVMAFSAPALQMVCIALAGFQDKSANPVFPRWYCYLMAWLAVGTSTGCAAIFFYSGPFAWTGVISFWIPATAFGIWLVTLCVLFWLHANRQATA